MTNALSRMMETRDWILADGATGTNLFNMGLSSGDAPEMRPATSYMPSIPRKSFSWRVAHRDISAPARML